MVSLPRFIAYTSSLRILRKITFQKSQSLSDSGKKCLFDTLKAYFRAKHYSGTYKIHVGIGTNQKAPTVLLLREPVVNLFLGTQRY